MEALALANQPKYIQNVRQRVLQPLAVQLKNSKGKPVDPQRIKQLEAFLEYLDKRTEMTPQLRAATHIDKGLQLVTDPLYNFPAPVVDRATRLLEKWEAANWGAEPGGGGDGGEAGGHAVTDEPAAAEPGTGTVDARVPPRDHPIFGEQGIMHGVLMVRKTVPGHRRTVFYRRNPAYAARNARVFGANGLAVGDWWPMQLVALVRGAHGSSQGGIAGDAAHGAYSIVVSGTYDDLDSDHGDTLWYAGSRLHGAGGLAGLPPDKKSTFTRALHTSARLDLPIRVLRAASAGNASVWAPSVGIRYDGLYHVTQVQTISDGRGGEIDRFRLERLPGQRPLAEVVRAIPTAAQKEAHARIQEGY